MSNDDAESMKERGNALFHQGKIQDALNEYSAISLFMYTKMNVYSWRSKSLTNTIIAILQNICLCCIKLNGQFEETTDLLLLALSQMSLGKVAMPEKLCFLLSKFYRFAGNYNVAEQMIGKAIQAASSAQSIQQMKKEQQTIEQHHEYVLLLDQLMKRNMIAKFEQVVVSCALESKKGAHKNLLAIALNRNNIACAKVLLDKGEASMNSAMLRNAIPNHQTMTALAAYIIPVMTDQDYEASWASEVAIALKIVHPVVVKNCKDDYKMVQFLSLPDASKLPIDVIQQVMMQDWQEKFCHVILKFCIELGGNPNLMIKGVPLLHTLIKQSNVDAIKMLLQANITTNVKDPEGDTALHVCARNPHKDVKQLEIWHLLVSSGFTLDVKNNNGCTPLHLACERLPLSKLIGLTSNFTLPELEIKNKHGKTAYEQISSIAMFTSRKDAKPLLVSLISTAAAHMRKTFESLLASQLANASVKEVETYSPVLIKQIGLFKRAIEADNSELVQWMIEQDPSIVTSPFSLDPLVYPVHVAAKRKAKLCFDHVYFDSDYVRATIAKELLDNEACKLFHFIHEKQCLLTNEMIEAHLVKHSYLDTYFIQLICDKKSQVNFKQETVDHLAKLFGSKLQIAGRIFKNVDIQIWKHALNRGWINMVECVHFDAITGLIDIGARYSNPEIYYVVRFNTRSIDALLATGHDISGYVQYISTIDHALVYRRYFPLVTASQFGCTGEHNKLLSTYCKSKHSNIQFSPMRNISKYADVVVHAVQGETKPYEKINSVPLQTHYVPSRTNDYYDSSDDSEYYDCNSNVSYSSDEYDYFE